MPRPGHHEKVAGRGDGQNILTHFARRPLYGEPERRVNFRPAMMNEPWPEFVTDEETTLTRQVEHTGWETVVFELEDHEIDDLLSAFSSAFSTAAIAP